MRPRQSSTSSRRDFNDDGFTMIEMIISTLLLPIVMGAIVISLGSLFLFSTSAANRTADAADAQVVSSQYSQDVQQAASLTTSPAAPQCGTGTQLLGLEWGLNAQTSAYQYVVSYVEVPNATGYSLLRNFCSLGISSTASSTSRVASDIPANQSPPVVTPASQATLAAAGWTVTNSITGVTFTVTEPLSHYTYALDAVPSVSGSSAKTSSFLSPTTGCGFASAGTGTYATSLCFVDFTSYNPNGSAKGCGGNAAASTVSAAVTNTPYILSFCISEIPAGAGQYAFPNPIPTYSNPPTSEAFLGNSGFYTNIPGDPALYQTAGGSTTTVNITNIQLTDPNGSAATGWYLVTGDAESTDSYESLTWTSNQPFTLIPNSSTSQIGNACAYPSQPSGIWLTGLGTTSVQCKASVDSDKTGTVMIQAPAPTTLTIKLVGSGLQGVFIGLLLP